jgi:hypothetical protein
VCRSQGGQAAGAAADDDHALSIQRHQRGNSRGLHAIGITLLHSLPSDHPGLRARIVEPIAPNLAALRRVSSNAELA